MPISEISQPSRLKHGQEFSKSIEFKRYITGAFASEDTALKRVADTPSIDKCIDSTDKNAKHAYIIDRTLFQSNSDQPAFDKVQ